MAGNSTAADIDPNASNVHLVYIPAGVFVVICPLLMALRIWARLRKGGSMGADDWTAIAALVSSLEAMVFDFRVSATDRPSLDIHAPDKRFYRGL